MHVSRDPGWDDDVGASTAADRAEDAPNRLTCAVQARIPSPHGEFQLSLYDGTGDGKEHLALVLGDVAGKDGVLVRVHSECLTGDVFGSLRCDCGEQLERSLELIGAEGAGAVVYLRQEGRGIGLLNKLRAYNLQDQGYDTVEANLLLGHEPDERDYRIAAEILADLGVRSVRLLTNNPEKIAALETAGIPVRSRVPIEVNPGPENLAYLTTKARRMSHLLHLDAGNDASVALAAPGESPVAADAGDSDRPGVTLSYAQSLDGSIAARPGAPLQLSGVESLRLTHRLRSAHDAILVGIGTVLADNPRLTVRLVEGHDPQPVVVDSRLRLPADANLFTCGRCTPWVVTTGGADPERQRALEALGARVLRVEADRVGRVDLRALLARLHEEGMRSLMVEGGARVITSFLAERLVDQIVITVAPRLVGGVRALSVPPAEPVRFPRLGDVRYARLGTDLVLWGEPRWDDT